MPRMTIAARWSAMALLLALTACSGGDPTVVLSSDEGLTSAHVVVGGSTAAEPPAEASTGGSTAPGNRPAMATTTKAMTTATGITATGGSTTQGNGTTVATTTGEAPTTAATTTTKSGPKAQFITFDGWQADMRFDFRKRIGARSSTGLPVSYEFVGNEQASAWCQISGDSLLVPMPEPGGRMLALPLTCTVRASQGGDANYLPATPVERSLVVNRVQIHVQVECLLLGTNSWRLTAKARPSGFIPGLSGAAVNAELNPESGSGDEFVTEVTPTGTPVSVTVKARKGNARDAVWGNDAVKIDPAEACR